MYFINILMETRSPQCKALQIIYSVKASRWLPETETCSYVILNVHVIKLCSTKLYYSINY